MHVGIVFVVMGILCIGISLLLTIPTMTQNKINRKFGGTLRLSTWEFWLIFIMGAIFVVLGICYELFSVKTDIVNTYQAASICGQYVWAPEHADGKYAVLVQDEITGDCEFRYYDDVVVSYQANGSPSLEEHNMQRKWLFIEEKSSTARLILTREAN